MSDPIFLTPLDDQYWMSLALDQADLATAHGDVPIGALVVHNDGEALASSHNRREVDSDPTAHAEILALREASRDRGHWRLDDCTLYVTLEPCAMCAGALVNARISRLVYGAMDSKAGAIDSLYKLASDSRLNHRFDSIGGVLASESRARLQAFFRELRARGEK
jgi:tRNA(adenine34) deaminase